MDYCSSPPPSRIGNSCGTFSSALSLPVLAPYRRIRFGHASQAAFYRLASSPGPRSFQDVDRQRVGLDHRRRCARSLTIQAHPAHLNRTDTHILSLVGGPAGLTALKTLFENGLRCTLFEAEADIGGTFKYRSYEHATLVSSKQLTAFSDFRFPPEQGDHVTLPQYVEYLRRYCDEFALWDRINLDTRVVSVRRPESGKGHIVEVQKKGQSGTSRVRQSGRWSRSG